MRDSVQAEVMMSFLVSEELSFRIPVELRYETCDPYAVRLTFHLPGDAPVTWAFGRELLIDGVGRPCGEGDVHIAPADAEVLGEVLIRLQVGATRPCSAPRRRRSWPSWTAPTSSCRSVRRVRWPTSTPIWKRPWTASWPRSKAAEALRRRRPECHAMPHGTVQERFCAAVARPWPTRRHPTRSHLLTASGVVPALPARERATPRPVPGCPGRDGRPRPPGRPARW